MEHQPGDARGRDLGFPTLNSAPPKLDEQKYSAKYCLPPHGVYITRVHMDGKVLPSVTNFGIRPTFHNATEGEYFETYVLSGWDDRLSSKHFSVDFIDRIRPEQRFASKDELIQRIQQDISIARSSHGL
jgi:riboflavin kinase/FMN adenylyltransferase